MLILTIFNDNYDKLSRHVWKKNILMKLRKLIFNLNSSSSNISTSSSSSNISSSSNSINSSSSSSGSVVVVYIIKSET